MPTSENWSTLFRELSAAHLDGEISRRYGLPGGLLFPRDPVLQGRGGDYSAYEEVLRDDQVASTFQQRRLAVTATEWGVQPGGDDRESRKAADFITETLTRLAWDSITDRMLYGIFYGYAMAECLWQRDGAQVALAEIKVRQQRRFGFDRQGRVVLLNGVGGGDPMPEHKFWHFRSGVSHDDDPYGLGLAHWLYWPVHFKRNGLKLWLIHLDKFGMPTAKGTYPLHATDEEKRKLLEAIKAIQTDAGIIVPEGMAVELLEAGRGGQVTYDTLLDRMNGAIAKVVLSQSMTTEAAGGQYKADVHKLVRNEVVKADADLICDSFNRSVARWLTRWNFPKARTPVVWRRVTDQPDLRSLAERDRILYQMGFQPSLGYVRQTYGGDWTLRQEESAAPGRSPHQDVQDSLVGE